MKQLARVEYMVRHLRTVFPYITFAKICNLLLNTLELRFIASRPRSLPPYLKVEPTPLCQLACPGCAHGTSDLKKQLSNREHLSIDEFKKILDPISHTLFGISLSLRGEPMLGKELLPIIEYSHSKNVAVSFPTNLSLTLNEEKISRLVSSGVDAIFISLDGASAHTYGQYRVGGDFDLVLRNVKTIARIRANLHRSRPRLIWKFVVLEHNRHEIAQVQNMYRKLGFDAYELVEDYGSEAHKAARQTQNAKLIQQRKGCYWAWHTTTIRADGIVAPCCLGHESFQLGNTRTEDIVSIWRGERYAQLRQGFNTMRTSDMNPVCARCLGVQN